MIHEISLAGIEELGYHGVFDFERQQGQEFVVDVRFRIEIDAASPTSDSLSATADYGQIIDLVRSRIAAEPVNLIETLARELMRKVFEANSSIEWVEITVHKPQAPVSRAIADISVTVSSSRAGL